MSAPDFRAFRTAVLDFMAVLQAETEHKIEDMATGQRASQYDAQWCTDMADAALELLVEHGVFANVGDAADEVEARAGKAAAARKAARLAAVAS